MIFRRFILLISLLLSFYTNVYAQETITFIVQTSIGSGADQVARFYATEMEKRSTYKTVVKNIPGGNGVLALNAFNNTKNSIFVANTSQSEQLNNPSLAIQIESLIPLLPLYEYDMFIVTSANSEIKSITDLKRVSEKRILFSGGSGIFNFRYNQQVDNTVGSKTETVLYKDRAQIVIDTANNLLDYSFFGSITAQLAPMVETNKLNILAVTGSVRSKYYPNVPSMQELGYTPINLYLWNAFMTSNNSMSSEVIKDMKIILNSIYLSKEEEVWSHNAKFIKLRMNADDIWPLLRKEQQEILKYNAK